MSARGKLESALGRDHTLRGERLHAADPTLPLDLHWDGQSRRKALPAMSIVKRKFRNCRYESHLLAMKDGVRIAVDVYLPEEAKDGKVPCVLHQARYMRAMRLRWPWRSLFPGSRPIDFMNFAYKRAFVAAGFALVSIDVRGTGASFGRWERPWQDAEALDSIELIDWIIRQLWSNGSVALWGLSYDGNAAFKTVALHHPAVKACVPMYLFWDMYNDIAVPGGLPMSAFVDNWSAYCAAIDSNDFSRLPKNGFIVSRVFKGVARIKFRENMAVTPPSSSDTDSESSSNDKSKESSGGFRKYLFGALARRADLMVVDKARLHRRDRRNLVKDAVREHVDNYQAAKDLATIRFADEPSPQVGVTTNSISAFVKAAAVASSGVPMYYYGGWLDATARPAIMAFVHAAPAGSRLIIGPWNHGGWQNVDLLGKTSLTTFDHQREVVHFISQVMKPKQLGIPDYAKLTASHSVPSQSNGSTGGLYSVGSSQAAVCRLDSDEQYTKSCVKHPEMPVAYYVMGLAQWRHAPTWPPPGVQNIVYYLQSGGTDVNKGELLSDASKLPADAVDTFEVQPGEHIQGVSRWDAMMDVVNGVEYRGLDTCGHRVYTSPPLFEDVELTGFPVVELYITSSDDDAEVFAYLEDVDESGKVSYITEGVFRAIHRKERQPEGVYYFNTMPGVPYHSFFKTDAQRLEPGVPALLRFDMLPTAFRFAKGHCIRVAFSGADRKHFSSDHTGSRTLGICCNSERPARIILPFLPW
eukprot:jgi/Chlat1/4683/Chrsp3S05620